MILVRTKGEASSMLRSTWVSAAKFTSASGLCWKTCSTAAASAMSPWARVYRGFSARSERLSGLPAWVSLSKLMTSTSWRLVKSSRMKFDPMKPAPPVTNTRTKFLLSYRRDQNRNSSAPDLFGVLCRPWRSPTFRNLVRASLRDEIRGTKQGLEGPRVRPPAVQNTVRQRFLLQVHIVDVRNLELIAPARLGPADFLEDGGVVEIDSGDGVVGFRILGLFFDTDDPTIRNLGAAESPGIRAFF